MFRKGGPKPWKTKPGGSLLDERVFEYREHGHPVKEGGGVRQEVEYGREKAVNEV
jgi:hypothetical protein